MSDNGRKRRGGGSGGDGGRKKKGHYAAFNGKPSDKAIPLGSCGILVTCEAGREFKAFDEVVRLLEESFQRLGKDDVGRSSGAAPAADAAAAAGDASGSAAEGGAAAAEPAAAPAPAVPAAAAKPRSIADELAAEVAGLKRERLTRFKRHSTDVRGTVYVEFPKDTECPAPEAVASEIAAHVKATRCLPARYVLRLLPVTYSCFASVEEVTAVVPQLVQRFFPADAAAGATFAVEFEHRSSSKLKRADVINLIAQAVPQPPYKVHLNAPDQTIVVQLVRNTAALSVVAGFKGLAKLNLRRLTEDEDEEAEGGEEGGQAAAAAKEEEQAGGDGGGAGAAAAAAEATEAAPAAAATADGGEGDAGGDAAAAAAAAAATEEK